MVIRTPRRFNPFGARARIKTYVKALVRKTLNPRVGFNPFGARARIKTAEDDFADTVAVSVMFQSLRC